LSQTLQKNPEKFDGQLVEVERKVISGLNPDVVFKRPT
jgi:hypothetical protein